MVRAVSTMMMMMVGSIAVTTTFVLFQVSAQFLGHPRRRFIAMVIHGLVFYAFLKDLDYKVRVGAHGKLLEVHVYIWV